MTTAPWPARNKPAARQYGGLALLLILGCGGGMPAQADQVGDSLTVNFHGTLKKKPCHIAGDRDIEVHFGNVGINKVDGLRYLQPVPYTLTCDELNKSWTLMLSLKGTAAEFEKTALKTNATGLGIRILKDGKPMEINTSVAIDYASPPKLQAVPVQQSGVTLPEQDFSATATLMAEYL
ncbi:fimbrial protein [Serratia proteamaculans]|uniref:Fimbrial protein n=1 Tax=Serratia proteamaculans TaxID=28151 RepID=A0A5Q2VBW1_SERPR|nr:fimbrial protein [Serratia proteamaculans]QGH61589.1 fimbrial protein [Serratia proteamaculans]